MSRYAIHFALSAALVAGGALVLESAGQGRAEAQTTLLAARLGDPRPAPEWGNKSWLNTDQPLSLEALRGQVVLLNFWVFTCYNCTNTVPSLVKLDKTYRDQGLTIIGVHTPEFPPYAGEHDKGNVQRALKQHHIEYPNTQDNDSRTWNLYGIHAWPSFVLIDKSGQIRYEGAGEFHVDDSNYHIWEKRIQTLLAEK